MDDAHPPASVRSDRKSLRRAAYPTMIIASGPVVFVLLAALVFSSSAVPIHGQRAIA